MAKKLIILITGLISLIFIFKSGQFLWQHPRLWRVNFFSFLNALIALIGSGAIAVHILGLLTGWPGESTKKIGRPVRLISLFFGLYLIALTILGIIYDFGLEATVRPDFLTKVAIAIIMFFVSFCILFSALKKR